MTQTPETVLIKGRWSSFIVTPGRYGPQLFPRSAWSEQITRYVLANGVAELWLQTVYVGEDLSFLAQVTSQVKALLLQAGPGADTEALYVLTELRELSASSLPQPVDVRRFPKLEQLGIAWDEVVRESLGSGPRLQRLLISDGFDETNPHRLDGLRELRSLALRNCHRLRTLDGLDRLPALDFLEIARCPRVDIEGISELKGLRTLELSAVGKALSEPRAIAEIAALTELEHLSLGGCGRIPTLAPLEALRSLRQLVFAGNTVVEDGDLTFLERLPSLTHVWFANRRHYSHRWQGLPHSPNARFPHWANPHLELPDPPGFDPFEPMEVITLS